MKKILFQGDSVTDCKRTLLQGENMGAGYPLLVQAELDFEQPGRYTFCNRGISGNRIVDVYARIKADIINQEPNLISFLVGINDVWHDFNYQNGVDAGKYERIYDMLLAEVQAALPDTRIMILEPFCLRGDATDSAEESDRWARFRAEVEKRAECAKRTAKAHGLTFIPLQGLFDRAARQMGNAYWLADGIHPTTAGHELIKREWLRAFASQEI